MREPVFETKCTNLFCWFSSHTISNFEIKNIFQFPKIQESFSSYVPWRDHSSVRSCYKPFLSKKKQQYHGRRKGEMGARPPLGFWKNQQKCFFVSFDGKSQISPLLGAP